MAAETSTPYDGPLSAPEGDEAWAWVEEALVVEREGLTPRRQQAADLWDAGKTVTEIAKELTISYQAAQQLLHAAGIDISARSSKPGPAPSPDSIRNRPVISYRPDAETRAELQRRADALELSLDNIVDIAVQVYFQNSPTD